MKNSLIVLSLLFALSASAQVQKNKTTTTQTTTVTNINAAAQKNLNDLMTVATDLKPEDQKALKELFITKYSMLAEGLSEERKRAVTESMEYRLSLLLDPATLTKVKGNTKLYNSLIN